MNENEFTALFNEWNSALQTGNPDKVVVFYASDAILLPTMSDQVRHNREEIRDYFVHFLQKGPAASIDESNLRTFGMLAINSGIYTFSFKNGTSVQGRFTFVYQWNDQRWQIVEHHSSLMPSIAR